MTDQVMSPDVQKALSEEPSSLVIKLVTWSFIIAFSIWSISAIDLSAIQVIFEQIQFNLSNDLAWNDNATGAFNGLNIVTQIVQFLFNPNRGGPNSVTGIDVDYISERFFSLKAYGVPVLMVQTLFIAFLGTFFGAILSVPFAFLSSKNITNRFWSNVGSTIVTMIRTVPIFIWGLMFVRVQGGAMAGVLAVAVSSIGMVSKLYIEVIEDIDKGIIDALDSTGATTFQKIRFGIIPQLTASFLSIVIYRFEINVKNATILGMVGAGGIGAVLIDALGNSNFGIVAVCLWGLIPTVLIIEYVSTKIRTKLV